MSASTAVSRAKPGMARISISRGLLYLLIVSFPFFSIEPKLFRPDWWIGGVFIVVFVFSVLSRGRFYFDPIGAAVLWFNISVLLSTVVNLWRWEWEAAQWSEFLTLWLQLVFATLLYYALASLRISAWQLRFVFKLWTSIAAVVAFYGIYQALARNLDLPMAYLPYLNPEPSPWSLEWGLGFAGYVRPSSVLREPTYLGNYLLAPLLITATLNLFRRGEVWLFGSKWWNRGSILVVLAGFIVAFSLAGYITLLGVIVAALFMDKWSRRLATRITARVAGILVVVGIGSYLMDLKFFEAIVERFKKGMPTLIAVKKVGSMGTSEGVRVHALKWALYTWMEYPFMGIGLNQIQFVEDVAPLGGRLSGMDEKGHIWNIWLEVLVQSGVFGFVLFLLVWIQSLRMMLAIVRWGVEPWRAVGYAFFFVLLATMIRGLTGGPFTLTLYWFYLGMASIIYRLARRDKNASVG